MGELLAIPGGAEDGSTVVAEDQYRAVLIAERAVTALERARTDVLVALEVLAPNFELAYPRPAESEVELVQQAIVHHARILARFIAHDRDGSIYTTDCVRHDMDELVELIEYLRDRENPSGFRPGRLSKSARDAVEAAKEDNEYRIEWFRGRWGRNNGGTDNGGSA